MKLLLNKASLSVVCLVLVINYVLEYQYIHYLSAFYDYMGFTLDFNLPKYIVTKILLIFFLLYTLFLYKKSKFVYAISIFLILFFYIPTSVLFSFKNIQSSPFICTVLFLLIFFIIAPIRIKISLINIKLKSLDFIVVFLVLICFIPIIILGSSKINLNTLIFKEIYETRAIHKQNTSALYNYVFMWEIKILLPMLLVYGFFRKKALYVLIGFFFLLFLYTISAHKSVYVAMAALIMFYFLGHDYISKVVRFLFYLVIFMLVVIPLFSSLIHSNMLHSMLYERVFFDQSLMTYFYFDFFHNKPIFFSESHFFDLFFIYPYNQGSAYLIATIYLHSPLQHANTGIVGDAFMNLGYTGITLISILFASSFAFLNSLDLDSRYFGLFFIFLFDFLNNSLLSTLLSGGFAILLFYAYFVMSKSNKLVPS